MTGNTNRPRKLIRCALIAIAIILAAISVKMNLGTPPKPTSKKIHVTEQTLIGCIERAKRDALALGAVYPGQEINYQILKPYLKVGLKPVSFQQLALGNHNLIWKNLTSWGTFEGQTATFGYDTAVEE